MATKVIPIFTQMLFLLDIFLINVLLIANIGFLGVFNFFGIVPNFLFIFLFTRTLRDKTNSFLATAFFCGFYTDLFRSSAFGANMLAFLICAFLLHQFNKNILFFDAGWKTALAMFSVSVIFINVFTLTYTSIFYKLGFFALKAHWSGLWERLLAEIFLGLIFLLPIWKLAGLTVGRFMRNKDTF